MKTIALFKNNFISFTYIKMHDRRPIASTGQLDEVNKNEERLQEV